MDSILWYLTIIISFVRKELIEWELRMLREFEVTVWVKEENFGVQGNEKEYIPMLKWYRYNMSGGN